MMRKFFVTLMTSMMGFTAAFAFWPEAADSNFEVGVGYRRDNFEWETRADDSSSESSIIGDGFRSKLHWKDLNIWQIQASGKYVTCDNLYFRGYFDYGWVTDGKVRNDNEILVDSVTAPDSFTSVSFDNESSKTKGGHVYDVNLAIGYQFRLCDNSFAITPVLGYAWNGQHLDFKRGDESTTADDTSSSSSSSVNNLHSKYKARWNGPFIGLDFDYRFCCEWSLYATYEFHWARYHARGDWNLRTDLLDGFEQHSDEAHGSLGLIGIRWDFCECWTASIEGRFQCFTAKHGKDKAKIAELSAGDIETRCFLYTPTRDIKWDSASISLNVGMMF